MTAGVRLPSTIAAIAIALSFGAAGAARADEGEPVPSDARLLFHPAGPGRGKVAVGLGLHIDQPLYATQGFLPIEPQIDLRIRVGLPAGFSAVAQLSTIFIENTITAGLAWATPLPELPRASVALEVVGGTLIGGLSGFGFDTFIVSPVVKPCLTIGWPMGDSIRWSLREEVSLSLGQHVLSGGSWASNRARDPFAGSTTTLLLENFLERRGNLFFGAGAVLSRSSQSLWLFFSQQTALVLYPRVVIGYVF